MIYQIFYNASTMQAVCKPTDIIRPFGVYEALSIPRQPEFAYDDIKSPNLSAHNTLCEWRVLYYVWKHMPSAWIGFTSWQHNRKGFQPAVNQLSSEWALQALNEQPLVGMAVLAPAQLMVRGVVSKQEATLKSQFLQWYKLENYLDKRVCDTREMPLGKYHDRIYWDFVMDEYRRLYGVDLEKELQWHDLAQQLHLHTWCNAFIATWDYFDGYMRRFAPIVLNMLDHFGSHPVDLELSYICERLIILFNYIQFSCNEFKPCPIKTDPEQSAIRKPPQLPVQNDGGIKADVDVDTSNLQNAGNSSTYRFSIIICSKDDEKFAAIQSNISQIFKDNTQLIRVAEARSLSEGYNRGIKHASADTVIFCHDDIQYLDPEIPIYIEQDLQSNEVVGVAGTSKLMVGTWNAAGHPYMHGQVIHSCRISGERLYQLCRYSQDLDIEVVQGIQALDGLFFAVRRQVLERLCFDEQVFDGFHLYDLDFTYAAFLNGAKIAVDHRIHLLHNSGGNYDADWQKYYRRFNRKYAGRLAAKIQNPRNTFSYRTSESLEALKTVMLSPILEAASSN